MIDPSLVVFAIESGVRLGRKIHEVLIDETAQRPLLLPLGDLFGSVTESEAMRFFTVEQPDLIKPGGSCHAIANDRAKLIQVYRAMRGVESAGGALVLDLETERTQLVRQLAALDQFDAEHQARSPVRRIFGTLIEIGVDYFAAHPEAMGRDSAPRKIVHAFVSGLQDTNFAEGTGRQILGDLLGSALRAIGENATLIDDDRRLSVLLGGVTSAVAEDLRRAVASEHEVDRHQLLRRIGSSIVRGAAGAFSDEIGLFLPDDQAARALVKDTLQQVLEGLRGTEDIFTNATVELVVKSALRATAENRVLLSDNKILQDLIGRTAAVLADRQWDKLFSSVTAGAVLHEAIEVARENIETLIRPDNPGEQVLAQALAAMAGSLSGKLAGGGSIQDLLSFKQVVELSRVVLQEVARNPEGLIGSTADDPRKTVLAQVIGSVAKALGDDPTAITSGEGILELVRVALGVAVQNTDKLVDVSSANPSTNLLFKILQQVVATVAKQPDPRKLISRTVLREILAKVLPVASANLEPLLAGKPRIVADAVAMGMALANGALSNRINGANLPVLIAHLLTQAAWNELDLADDAKVTAAALAALRAVSLESVNPV